MSEPFDAYQKWLGIQPKDQPPNHYRLLGIELFEDDADTIDNAAEQRMGHVRKFQMGSRSALSQQILNELAAARICLLNADKKRCVDEQLQRELQRGQTPVPAAVLPPTTQVAPTAAVGEAPEMSTRPAASSIAVKPARPGGRAPRPSIARQAAIVGSGCAVVMIAIVLIVLNLGDEPTPPESGNRKEPRRPDVSFEPPEVRGQAELNAGATRLTGQSPSTTSGGTDEIDLLALISLARDVRGGTWSLTGGVLRNSNITSHDLHLPCEVPAQYDLTAEVARVRGTRGVTFHLVFQGRRVSLVLDGKGRASGLAGINGKPYDKNPTTVGGRQLSSQPATVVCQVRSAGIHVRLNNQTLIDWTGSVQELEPSGESPPTLGIGTHGAVFNFTKLTLRETAS